MMSGFSTPPWQGPSTSTRDAHHPHDPNSMVGSKLHRPQHPYISLRFQSLVNHGKTKPNNKIITGSVPKNRTWKPCQDATDSSQFDQPYAHPKGHGRGNVAKQVKTTKGPQSCFVINPVRFFLGFSNVSREWPNYKSFVGISGTETPRTHRSQGKDLKAYLGLTLISEGWR
jgi:hypothetical protein